jgi:hypothetical protein
MSGLCLFSPWRKVYWKKFVCIQITFKQEKTNAMQNRIVWRCLNLKREMDITNNLRIVEWLKADLVETVGTLLKSLMKAGNDATTDAIATLIIIAYILGRRVGISFQVIEMRIKLKLNNSINDADELEQWTDDLTHLQNYLEGKEIKKR